MKNSPYANLKEQSFNSRERQKFVADLFDDLAPKYDRFNRWVTFRRDEVWRRKAIDCLGKQGRGVVLDLAAGTGDLGRSAKLGGAKFVHIFDISLEMLHYAQAKLGHSVNGTQSVGFEAGSAHCLPFQNGSMDAVVSGFAMRNVFHFLDDVLREMHRVLKPGGTFAILELSQPTNRMLRLGFNFHMKAVMPLIGRITTGKRTPFAYLYETAMTFLSPTQFKERLENVGFADVGFRRFLLGGIAIHYGRKPS